MSASIIPDFIPLDRDEIINKCLNFLKAAGITVIERPIKIVSFLPGLSIEDGRVIYEKEALHHPGDLLHEAGHVAVVPAAERHTLNGNTLGARPQHEAEEMMAIAWSYAACVHIGLHPYEVFHKTGYGNGGHSVADNFIQGNYFGVPMLQWTGLTLDDKNALENKCKPYPEMIKWLRD